MTIPDLELQEALEEYQEWGEKLRTPRDIRIAALLRHRSEAEVGEVMKVGCGIVFFSHPFRADGVGSPRNQGVALGYLIGSLRGRSQPPPQRGEMG
jgi:hypothetical protein